MKKRSRILSTGTRSGPRRATAFAALTFLLLASAPSQAQSVKLRVLTLPPGIQSGSWVSYQIQVDSKKGPPRRFTQRLAIVAREGSGDEAGVWAELKTVQAGKARIERGYFTRGVAQDAERPAGADTTGHFVLRRYQLLTPDGKLYEYPVGGEGGPLPDEDISAMDLLEFKGGRTAESLGPDTLRVGRKVVPCTVERVTRYGADEWAGDDTTFVNRAVMTRTVWWNPAIPVTGYARTILEVSTERAPAGGQAAADSVGVKSAAVDSAVVGSAAVAGSAAAGSAAADSSARLAPPARPQRLGAFYRAEVTLLDLGKDAVPEITQPAEPAPEEASPRSKAGSTR